MVAVYERNNHASLRQHQLHASQHTASRRQCSPRPTCTLTRTFDSARMPSVEAPPNLNLNPQPLKETRTERMNMLVVEQRKCRVHLSQAHCMMTQQQQKTASFRVYVLDGSSRTGDTIILLEEFFHCFTNLQNDFSLPRSPLTTLRSFVIQN